MDFKTYQELSEKTINYNLNKDELRTHAVLGIAGEAGEVADHFKKVYQGHSLDVQKVIDECGDVLWHLTELAIALDTTLEEIATRNIEKLKNRYPQGFSINNSINRKD